MRGDDARDRNSHEVCERQAGDCGLKDLLCTRLPDAKVMENVRDRGRKLVGKLIQRAQDAGSLPSFFPGYAAKSHAHHNKHAIAAVVVGVACLVFAWFQTGSKATSS